jgi:hypothetical protein
VPGRNDANADHDWQSLSIPRGQSQQYNAAPTREKKPT